MRLARLLIRVYLNGLYRLRHAVKIGPFGPNGARIVATAPTAGDNPLKAALYRHHVKQVHEASCSVATVVTVINAVKSLQGLAGKPIRQHEILDTVHAAHWKQRMAPGGHRGRRGLPLQLLGQVVRASFDAYRIPYAAIEAVQMPRRPGAAPAVQKQLWQRLADFERKGNGLVIAHFDQGAFVPALSLPHISPVGGFDPASGDVIIFDVDPDQQSPYNVTFQTFCRGLASNYHYVFTPFGYGSGGYVYVRLG